ncbi:MAG TPA: zinc finger protein [Pseudonocardiaceae bacterium]|nr:zinc finger protein [Pseudonocardiaceae bacterium]
MGVQYSTSPLASGDGDGLSAGQARKKELGVPPLPVVPGPYPEPRLFAWFPLAGQRHAIDRRDRNVPLGAPMRCLCGATHSRGEDGDMEWLWHTCEQCWAETCKIVGLRPRR